jgi:hypothetical protein
MYSSSRIRREKLVQGLDGSHVMRLRTDAADAAGDRGHVFGLAAAAELLEAAQFRHLEVGVGDIPFVIQENVDLAVPFEASDGIDADPLHSGLLPQMAPDRLNL